MTAKRKKADSMSTTRRDFLINTAVAGSAMSLGLHACAAGSRKLKILVLGGTSFVGPHQVRPALARGHEVTLFNRGRTNTHLFPEVEKLIGDRVDNLSALEGREWDVVIDNSAIRPSWVRRSAQLLKDSVGIYLFTSTRSVFSDLSAIPMDVDGTVYAVDPSWTEEDEESMSYGERKITAEKEAIAAFGERALIIRPGLIVGPGDTTDRFTYWPVRVHRGGEVLAPGDPDNPVMFIDVRDMGDWYIHLLENSYTGTFMALGPDYPLTFRTFLEGVREGVASTATFTWMDREWLMQQGVRPYSHMPLWMPAVGRNRGFNRFDLTPTWEAGLTYRPLSMTAKDTLDYHFTRPEERQARLRAGITAEREAELFSLWYSRI